MRTNRGGFTLIEMVIVVLIIGILTSMGLPYYYKTIESAKASDAVSIGHMLANAYRMYQVDHPGITLSGGLTNTCNTASCTPNPGPGAAACELVACNYVARQEWDMGPSYTYTVGVGGFAASARRTVGQASGDYAGWGYDFDFRGRCIPVGTGVPDCPKF